MKMKWHWKSGCFLPMDGGGAPQRKRLGLEYFSCWMTMVLRMTIKKYAKTPSCLYCSISLIKQKCLIKKQVLVDGHEKCISVDPYELSILKMLLTMLNDLAIYDDVNHKRCSCVDL